MLSIWPRPEFCRLVELAPHQTTKFWTIPGDMSKYGSNDGIRSSLMDKKTW